MGSRCGELGVGDIYMWLGYSFHVSAEEYVVGSKVECLGGLITSPTRRKKRRADLGKIVWSIGLRSGQNIKGRQAKREMETKGKV